MEWLGGWLRQIVLVILLATFIDLILPSSTMQRYVKTVISLFILLTLLNPVFGLLHDKWDPDRLIAEATAAGERSSGGSGGALPSLNAIERQSDQLREMQNRQSRRLVEEQLAARMKENIEKQSGMAVKSVRVTTVQDEKGQASIGNVLIALQEQGTGKPQAGKPGNDISIEPVQPVNINIQPLKTEAGAKPAQSASSPKEEQTKAAVLNLLRQEWQLKPEQVDITFEKK
ncbi:stage III sporulation protein AF [Paenibacillus hamazuiensis]|uniref:stage III sporulation protein AF n=1 Tax=Paenibacillus hamazuiensis TaxID=2936508 RepID=UPI00200FF461|nr:stage III sporulation protein AF [Paenibacillus hamazuiensis]